MHTGSRHHDTRAGQAGFPLKTSLVVLGLLTVAQLAPGAADARVDSWYTARSGRYARIYTSDANKAAGNAVTTWSNGTFNQALPAYCGVQEVYSSASWVYIRSTGLGSHVMGPWYLNAARTQVFPNWPINTKALYRIPRTPTVPATKVLTGLGAIGYFVDGVSMFDTRDAFYWNGTSEVNGTGNWNRDAYVNEGVTFDNGYAHQPQDGSHHYHAQPIALRHLLGDHVDYVEATRSYAESAGPVTRHSPILAWVRDGFPLYGPYGYASASNSASGVRRMISGYVRRNGQNGTDNLAATGRASIPQWAVRLYNVASNVLAGPAVGTTYPLGRYMEDNAYLGDLGRVQGVDFDLDEYGGRWCVTPEFPSGTYAYFTSIDAAGTPVFPYNIGRAFHGNPTGAAVASITETVTTNFVGGTNMPLQLRTPALAGGQVTLTWSAVEGGTYRVESTGDLGTWATNASGIAAVQDTGSYTGPATGNARFHRVTRTAVASFDPVSGTGGGGGGGTGILSVSPTNAARNSTFTLTVNLDPAATPALPPVNAPVNSVTIGAIAGTSRVHVSTNQVTASFTIPVGAAQGPQTVTVIFPGPPGNPTATVTYTLPNGFNIQ